MNKYREFLTEIENNGVTLTEVEQVCSQLKNTVGFREYKKKLHLTGSKQYVVLAVMVYSELVKLSYGTVNPSKEIDLIVTLTATGYKWLKNGAFKSGYEKSTLADELYQYMTGLGFSLYDEADNTDSKYYKWVKKAGLGEPLLFVDLTGISKLNQVAGKMLEEQSRLLKALNKPSAPINGTVK